MYLCTQEERKLSAHKACGFSWAAEVLLVCGSVPIAVICLTHMMYCMQSVWFEMGRAKQCLDVLGCVCMTACAHSPEHWPQAFGAASYVPSLVLERNLFVRERADGMYHVITCVEGVESSQS